MTRTPRRPLPPLGSLRAFEATARLGSTLAAADELLVTHGAISRQIKLLEDWAGTNLFERQGKRLALTEQGTKFRDQVGAALDQISMAGTRLRDSARKTRGLTVNALPTFAMRWLLPRLVAFQREHTDIELRLQTSDAPLDHLTLAGSMIAIRREIEHCPPHLLTASFLAESEIPVCAPTLLAEHPVRSAQDLMQQTLLHADTRPHAWDRWLNAAGVDASHAMEGLRFDHFYLALQAATDGLGIALGPLPIIADDLASGRLVTPLTGPILPSRSYSWYIASESMDDPAIIAFCTWLETQGDLAN